jgi:hypothetical protein
MQRSLSLRQIYLRGGTALVNNPIQHNLSNHPSLKVRRMIRVQNLATFLSLFPIQNRSSPGAYTIAIPKASKSNCSHTRSEIMHLLEVNQTKVIPNTAPIQLTLA